MTGLAMNNNTYTLLGSQLSYYTGKPPRVLGVISYPLAGRRHTRRALSYPVWMAQRVLDVYAAMTPAEQQTVRAWLGGLGGEALLDLKSPRMQRVGLAATRVG